MSIESESVNRALIRTIDEICNWFTYKYSTFNQEDHLLNSRHWHYVAISTSKLVEQISLIRAEVSGIPEPSFIEVGTGIGVVSKLISEMIPGVSVHGIEKNSQLVEISNELFPGLDLVEDDAMTFNEYGDFDIIYYYRLMKDMSDQVRLEKRIEAQMKSGAFLIANFKADDDILRSGQFIRLGQGVFQKR
jgi:hypothetical protein